MTPPTGLAAPTLTRLLAADADVVPMGSADAADPADPALALAAESAAQHLARLGPCPPAGDLLDLVDLVDPAGLTGHGGAHVPVALKWRAALADTGPLTLVANAAESEPLSAKDGVLLRQRPHLVLDGLALAARALGADRLVVWLHGDDDGARDAVVRALAEREPGLPPVEVISGPSHYLAGESTAIARAVQGGPALPAVRRPPQPSEPSTLVHNVETLARLALLARGVAPTSVLVTVLTPTGRRVLEVERTTRVADVLADLGLPPAPRAVLVGGYGGTWVPGHRLAPLRLDPEEFRAAGLSLGAGVLAPLPDGVCGVAQTAALVAYLASMSARQCGPCLFGLPALASGMALLAAGSAPSGELARLLADVRAVEGRGACRHPDGATRLISSAVHTFGGDLAEHTAGAPCRAERAPTFPVPAGPASWPGGVRR